MKRNQELARLDALVPWIEDESPGQKALNTWIAPSLVHKKILYVGTGSCAFADLFPKSAVVYGITAVEAEWNFAREKKVCCELIDKYTPALAAIPKGFDFIIDVNPFSYAIDLEEAKQLLADYQKLLLPTGSVLTHIVGLRWRWSLMPKFGFGKNQIIPLEICQKLIEPYFNWVDCDGGIIRLEMPKWNGGEITQ